MSSGEELKKQYREMVYDRDYVVNDEVFDKLSAITGIPRSLLEKAILDCKVTPVIVLNDLDKWSVYQSVDLTPDLADQFAWDYESIDTNSLAESPSVTIKNKGYYFVYFRFMLINNDIMNWWNAIMNIYNNGVEVGEVEKTIASGCYDFISHSMLIYLEKGDILDLHGGGQGNNITFYGGSAFNEFGGFRVL